MKVYLVLNNSHRVYFVASTIEKAREMIRGAIESAEPNGMYIVEAEVDGRLAWRQSI